MSRGGTQLQPVRILRWLLAKPAAAEVLQLVRCPDVEEPSVLQACEPPDTPTMHIAEGLYAAAQEDCDVEEAACKYSLRWVNAERGVIGETSLGRFVPSEESAAALMRPGNPAQHAFIDLIDRVLTHDRANTRQHHHAMQQLLRSHEANSAQQQEMLRDLRATQKELLEMVRAQATQGPPRTAAEEAQAVIADKVTDALLEAAKPVLPEVMRDAKDLAVGMLRATAATKKLPAGTKGKANGHGQA